MSVEDVPTMQVKLKQRNNRLAVINVSDFDEELHAHVNTKAAKDWEATHSKSGVRPDPNTEVGGAAIVPPGSASGEESQAASRREQIEEIRKTDPKRAAAMEAGTQDPVDAALGEPVETEDTGDDDDSSGKKGGKKGHKPR